MRKKRDYRKEIEKRKTAVVGFSCPSWLFDILARQKNKTEFIIRALEREVNISKDLGERKRQIEYRKRELVKKMNRQLFEMNEEIEAIEEKQKIEKKKVVNP